MPFDELVPWLCEDLIAKYENEEAERPEWLDKDKFVKRIVTIFRWHGKDEEKVGEALFKLFGTSGSALEGGANGQLS